MVGQESLIAAPGRTDLSCHCPVGITDMSVVQIGATASIRAAMDDLSEKRKKSG